jgi:hypothetical protein
VTVATGPSTVYTTTGSAMGALLERPVRVRVAVARQAEDPFPDDVALDLAGAAGDGTVCGHEPTQSLCDTDVNITSGRHDRL